MELDLTREPVKNRARIILEQVALRGHKMTGPRRALVEWLALRQDTFTAQDVFEQVHNLSLPIGRATVFRTLDLLAELQLLHRLHNEGGAHLFAVCAEHAHHHHFRCLSCGAVQTVEAPGVETEIERLGSDLGLLVLEHVLELVGQCAACQDRESPAVARNNVVMGAQEPGN